MSPVPTIAATTPSRDRPDRGRTLLVRDGPVPARRPARARPGNRALLRPLPAGSSALATVPVQVTGG